ncbi:gliding motility-associated C-terminal domain-containing protein [Flavobacterium humi]|uniref:Gliding motility-associated C-terminal domain-containing protein n=1 Tax=Flavobacterium humi TaxID=2562683 RepID=A0A4Z0LBX0_9FLAO|nr:gliding motility-associated C-terminal domain-containing protein [Flavobacterium humi]TGD59374.1 gliding motility-associated C-terminal domain-containing protein [Flavobacterium humi]
MENFTPKRLNFKHIFLLLVFFSTSHLGAQNCAGLNSLYQTKGAPDGNDGHVDVYEYDFPSRSFINIQSLTTGLDFASGAASAFNTSTGLLYIRGDGNHSSRDIRVFDPANNFAYVGVIDLTGSGGISIYDNLFSVDDYIYVRDQNGDNLARFNAVNVVFTGQVATAGLTSYIVNGTNLNLNRCFDYAYYKSPLAASGAYYGMKGISATSCRLVIIDQATNNLTTRNLNLTNPSASNDFSGNDFGAIWVDESGTLFAFNNNTGNVYVVPNVESGTTSITWMLPSGSSSSNDGFGCGRVVNPVVVTTNPSCSAAGTATIDNYLDDPNISYIFYDSGGNPVNYVSVGMGGVITGLHYGETYTVALHMIDINFTFSPSDPFTIFDILTPVTASVTPNTATTNCASPSVTLVATGGVTYSWSPAAGLSDPNIPNPVATPLSTTTYTVTVTGANGCTATATATVTVNSTPVIPTISTTPPTCLAAGTSTISNYSASNTYTFSPAGPTINASGLISGMVIGTSYTVTVAANAICAAATSAPFSNAAMLVTPAVPTISSTPPTCFATGSSTISNYSASNTYTFSPVGPTVNATGLISGMTIGTSYTVTASNGSCTSGASAAFSNAAMLVTPAVPTISSVPPTCFATGTSTISNYSASNTYTFSPTGPTVNAAGLISGMSIGVSYTVTTSNGTCTSGASAPFSNAAMLITPAVPTITSTPPTCFATGTSTISNYSAGNTYIFSPVGPTVNATGLISGMTIGTSYTVTASNGSCTSGTSAPFSNAAMLVTPAIPTISSVPPTCFATGSSTISNYSAGNTYTFSPTGPTVNAAGLISGMTIGVSYTVTSSNGTCTSGASAPFSNADILVTPAVPTISSVPPTCFATGTSTISNYSAGNTYTFTPAGPTVDATGLISGMTIGVSYTVTTSNGFCTSGASLPFSNAAMLVTPAIPTISSTLPTCFVAGTSTINNYSASNAYTFTPVGPTVDATGLISGMIIGTVYTVTSSNGTCTSGASAPFSNAAMLVTPAIPTITSTPPTCFATGSSTISNYSASNTYTFSPVGPTVNAAGLISGMTIGVSYTVTTSNGFCTSGASAPFNNAAMLVTPAIPTISTTPPTCFATGSSTISNYNASNTYTFTPAGPTVNAAGLISGMTIGVSYTVTSSNGTCTSGASAPFSNADILVTPAVPTISSVPPTCFATGSSTISNYSAGNTYTFSPTGPTVNAAGLISGMTIGVSYTVTTSNGFCTSGASAPFSNAAILVTPAIPTISSTLPTCFVAGSSTISNYSASNTYTFSPVGPTVDATGLISGMTIGISYTVTTSNGSCTSGASASFSNADILVTPAVPTISSTPPTCFATGSSTISNYSAGNTYTFSPTGPTVNATGLISGMTIGVSYTVTTSNGSCTSGASAPFSNAAMLVTPAIPTISSTLPTCFVAGSSTISNYNASNTYTFTPVGPTVDATGLISGMTIGVSYAVTTSNGTCTSGASAPFSNADILVTPAIPTISSVPPTCFATGSSTISNYSAGNTYTFTPAGPTVDATGLISGMTIGVSYTVTTSNGFCTSGASLPFSNASMLVTPAIPTISTTPPTCFVTGTSTISNYNASNTYMFTPVGPTVDAVGGISGMIIGMVYTVTTSNGSCTSGASAPFSNAAMLVTPAIPTISSVPPTCFAPGTSAIGNYSASNTYTFTPTGPTVNTTGLISGMTIGVSYSVITSNGTCTSGASAPFSNADVLATPSAPITDATTQPICPSTTGSVVLSGLPSGNWTINPGGITGNTPTVEVTDLQPGTYNFTVTNDSGCTSTPSADVVIINVICPECEEINKIKVFNAVSPGIVDGLNDFFNIEALDAFDCYPTNTVQIYNRWGVLVFERNQYTNDTTRGFVGISEGRTTVSRNEKLPEGTYYYIINYTDKRANAFHLTGFLELKWN